jgi:23S rRNA (guanosine2251-2'-O)-methyltransferase
MKDKWIWGIHSLDACVETHPELLIEIFVLEESPDRDFQNLKKKILDAGLKLQSIKNTPGALRDKRTQGIFAQLKDFPIESFREFRQEISERWKMENGQWVYLDRIQDPQNYGAILRSAAAFGVKGVFVSERDQCPVTGTVAQVSAGQIFRVPLYSCEQPSELIAAAQESKLQVLALDSRGENISRYLTETKGSILWMLGSEHQGVQKRLLERADTILSIPMNPDVESLNASNAAAISFFEAQKNFKTH